MGLARIIHHGSAWQQGRDRHAADNTAWLKRFAISLLKQANDKESVAMRRRMAGWNPEYLSQVLGLSMV